MSPDFSTSLWSLPGPHEFIQRIGQDLRNGVSQVIFSPPLSNRQAFMQSLRDCLDKEFYLNASSIDLSIDEYQTPFELFCQFFPKLLENQYLEKAIDTSELPDVILLENVENFSFQKYQDLIDFIARWAEACRSSGAKHSLFLPIQLDDPNKVKLPPSDVRLKYHVAAGFPSSLEVQLLCRQVENEMDAKSQWRGYILASLAGSDLFLCDLLWDQVFNPIETIIDIFLKYADKSGWKKDNFNGYFQKWRPKPPSIELSITPTEANFGLLGSGKTIFTPEYGEEIHPGLLAINNMHQEIIHRIWRAQAAMLLPMVDDVRRRICNHFSKRKGENWAVINNKILTLPLELGELKTYIDTLPSSDFEKQQWRRSIHQTCEIRNELAHYTPISYQTFSEFWRLNSKVHNMIM